MSNYELNLLKNQYAEKIRIELSLGIINRNKDGKIKKSIKLLNDINTGKSRRIQAEGNTIEECAEKLAKKYFETVEKKTDVLRFRTFGEVANEWYENKILSSDTSDGGKKNYKTDLTLHILPKLKDFDIAQLKAKDFQNFLNGFENKGVSMVKKIRMTVLRIVKYAMENEYMPYRMINLDMPKTIPIQKKEILTEELITALFKAYCQYPPALVFLAMLGIGIRPCELYELKYTEINIENNTIHIPNSKTDNGIRTVPIPKFILSLILVDKIKLEQKGLKPTYIFHQQIDPLKPHTAETLSKTWETTLRYMDIVNGATVYRNKIIKTTIEKKDELTPYCLRHTYCSLLNDCGISSYYKKKLMGHSLQGSVTDYVYTHTTDEKVALAAKPFLEMITRLYENS